MSEYEPNATAASLLGFLHEGPMSGWDLVTVAQERIGGFWSLTQSQVYRELVALAGAGYVTAGTKGPRDRRPYSITEAGRAVFRDWLLREPGRETIRFPLLLSYCFGAHLDKEKLGAFLKVHRYHHRKNLDKYVETARNLKGSDGVEAVFYGLAVTEFGIAYETMVLKWFDDMSNRLESLPAAASGS